jgi:hypothetical protein
MQRFFGLGPHSDVLNRQDLPVPLFSARQAGDQGRQELRNFEFRISNFEMMERHGG